MGFVITALFVFVRCVASKSFVPGGGSGYAANVAGYQTAALHHPVAVPVPVHHPEAIGAVHHSSKVVAVHHEEPLIKEICTLLRVENQEDPNYNSEHCTAEPECETTCQAPAQEQCSSFD